MWAVYNAESDPALLGMIYLVTRTVAIHYRVEDDADQDAD
jgi:hypothetical protein